MAAGTGALGTGGRIVHAESVPGELAAEWRALLDGWFEDPAADAGSLRVATPLGDAHVKLERPRSWKGSLVRLGARRPRSARAFRRGRALVDAGLPTPEPWAWLADVGPQGPRACLVTRFVEASDPWAFLAAAGPEPSAAPSTSAAASRPLPPGAGTVARAAGHALSAGNAEEQLEELLHALAGALARLHGAGFRHRDLKAPNVLVRRTGYGATHTGEIEVLWIDLDGLRRPAVVDAAVRVRDLARLCTSFASADARAAGVQEADAWPRFLALYLEAAKGDVPPAVRDDWLARTRRWSARHVEKNLVRGRPIA